MGKIRSSEFVHLHVHSALSLDNSTIPVTDLFAKSLLGQCLELGMDTVAVTDSGTMFNALRFYREACEKGVKPIIGCEVNIAPSGRRYSGDQRIYHLVLLAMNRQGYRNLVRLATSAALEGFHRVPRIDYDLLAEYNEGLIALTGCAKGEVPFLVKQGDLAAPVIAARRLQKIFPDRLYLEIQRNALGAEKEMQARVNTVLVSIGRELGIPLVATNNCHYLYEEEAEACELLWRIRDGRVTDVGRIAQERRRNFSFRSSAEMRALFHDLPQAIHATREIADRCDLYLDIAEAKNPLVPLAVPAGETLDEFFRREVEQGFAALLNKKKEDGGLSPEEEKCYRRRLQQELATFQAKENQAYFLFVADMVNWARAQAVPVGPGRGYTGCSLVAYCLGITEIDPIAHGLYFQRLWASPDSKCPDLAIDFCSTRAGEVIGYMQKKYGGLGQVVQVLDFAKQGARKVLAGLSQVVMPQEIPIATMDQALPRYGFNRDRVGRALDAICQSSSWGKGIVEFVRLAENLPALQTRPSWFGGEGVCLAVCRGSLQDIPLWRDTNGAICSQYDAMVLDTLGVVRCNILKHKHLTLLDQIVRQVRKVDPGFAIANIPLDDANTFALLAAGETNGVFQLQPILTPGALAEDDCHLTSDGELQCGGVAIPELLKRLAPQRFSDLVALLALHRPGPLELGMMDSFIMARHGSKGASHLNSLLAPYLEETYGLLVYQEQFVYLLHRLAGYTLEDAVSSRRILAIKSPALMAEEQTRFYKGARSTGMVLEDAESVFEYLCKHAGYLFCKGHAVGHGLLTYRMAYLKANYRQVFTAVIGGESDANGSIDREEAGRSLQ